MKINKKIRLIFIFCFMVLSLTGCSSNNSAKNVAESMVKYLSQEKYEKISNLVYQGNSYFDEEVFMQILEDNNLLIPGNSKIKIKEVGKEIKDVDGNSTIRVKIEIDNKSIYNIDTIQIDGKWYVYVPNFYDVDIVLAVPKNSTVKLNNKKLTDDYKITQEVSFNVQHPSISTLLNLDNVLMETYVIKNPLKGEYSIELDGEDNITDVIYTYNDIYNVDSSNYVYDYSDDKGVTYVFNINKEDENVKAFVDDYLEDIYSNAVLNKTIEGVEKYFDKDSDDYDDIESDYEDAISNFGDAQSNSLPNTYYDDFKISKLEYKGIYNYNDDNIVVCFTYRLDYKYHKKNKDGSNYDSDYNKTVNTIMVLKKTEKGYIIKKGHNLFIN